jgi:hypothetical protein
MDSVYTNHQDERMPSLFKTKIHGRGVAEFLSSPRIGERTASLLDKSMARPIGDVSAQSSVIGSAALLESSDIVVAVKTSFTSSVLTTSANGWVDLVNNPISVEAVDETTKTSLR